MRPAFTPAPRAVALALSSLAPALSACGMCEPDQVQPSRDVAASSAIASAARMALPGPIDAAASLHDVPRACRVIVAQGMVRTDNDAGAELAADRPVHDEDWLALGSDTRLVLKDPRTARETTFRGPARAKACVDGLEESWVASGAFESTWGSGESPGAEEWVVTPLGVVRFGAARLTVEVLAKEVRVRVGQGVAFVWTATDAAERRLDGGLPPGGTDEGWTRVGDGVVTVTPAVARSAPEAAHVAVAACASLGNSSRDLAVALLSAPPAGADGGPDGEARRLETGALAAKQVTARRLARAACTVAGLRVDMLPASSAKGALLTSLKEAIARYRELPLAR